MSPKWFRRGKNCFIAASWAPESRQRLAIPDPAGAIFIDLFQAFIRGLAGASPAGMAKGPMRATTSFGTP
jgi:hypothetical protein